MYSLTIGSIFIIFLFTAIDTFNIFQKDTNNYGAYDISWTKYELCKGPKFKNSTVISTNITKQGNSSIGYFNFTFLTDTKFQEIKIVVYSLNAKGKNLLWTYKIPDPCKHFAFATVIYTYLKSSNCIIKKDSYCFSANFNEITDAFFGKTFFYGEFMLKVTGYNKQDNIFCLQLIMTFAKKARAKLV